MLVQLLSRRPEQYEGYGTLELEAKITRPNQQHAVMAGAPRLGHTNAHALKGPEREIIFYEGNTAGIARAPYLNSHKKNNTEQYLHNHTDPDTGTGVAWNTMRKLLTNACRKLGPKERTLLWQYFYGVLRTPVLMAEWG